MSSVVDISQVENQAVKAFWHNAFHLLKKENDDSQLQQMRAVNQDDPDVAAAEMRRLASNLGFQFSEDEYRAAVAQIIDLQHAAGEIADEDYESGEAMSGSLIGCTIVCTTVTCCLYRLHVRPMSHKGFRCG
jgi:hypothetical protein